MEVFNEPKVFQLDHVFSWGLKKDKFKNYSLPIKPDDETVNQIKELVDEHDVRDPFYGETMYLKIKALSDKQKKELLDCGKCYVKVKFEAVGVYTGKNDNKYITFKVTGLKKLEEIQDEPPSDDFDQED